MLQRKPLNVAISVAFGATFAVSTGVQADTAFWPHVVVSDQVDTIVSVINTADDSTLHYSIIYKDGRSNSNPCFEYNTLLPSSKNDIQTIDLGAADAASSVLFEKGDGTGNVKWKGADFGLGSVARTRLDNAPIRAFLLIDNEADEHHRSLEGGNGASLSGEATILEYDVGASWGYDVSENVDLANAGRYNSFDYDRAASESGYKTPLLPMMGGATTTVAFMVTPVLTSRLRDEKALIPANYNGDKSDQSEAYTGGSEGNYTATIGARGAYGSRGAYDRDENFISGSIDRTVTCIGRVDSYQLFSDSVLSSRDAMSNGGFTYLANFTKQSNGSTTKTAYNAAVIYKIEYGAEFDGLPLNGNYNNGLRIPTPVFGWSFIQ